MKRVWWAALGAAAVMAVPAPANAAENSVIVKYKAGSAAKAADVLGTIAANGAQVVRVA